MDENEINELFAVGGIGAVRDKAGTEVRRITAIRDQFRYERWAWYCLAWIAAITSLGVVGCFFWAAWSHSQMDIAANQALSEKQQAQAYKMMLFENRIDPATGKRWGQ
jgi:hypothetical protein